MRVLDRYVIKEVLKGTFIALIILYTLFNLFTLRDELKDRGVGGYDYSIFLCILAYCHRNIFIN